MSVFLATPLHSTEMVPPALTPGTRLLWPLKVQVPAAAAGDDPARTAVVVIRPASNDVVSSSNRRRAAACRALCLIPASPESWPRKRSPDDPEFNVAGPGCLVSAAGRRPGGGAVAGASVDPAVDGVDHLAEPAVMDPVETESQTGQL